MTGSVTQRRIDCRFNSMHRFGLDIPARCAALIPHIASTPLSSHPASMQWTTAWFRYFGYWFWRAGGWDLPTC